MFPTTNSNPVCCPPGDRLVSRSTRGPRYVALVGTSHPSHHAAPLASPLARSHQYNSGRMIGRGKPLPLVLPPWVPAGGPTAQISSICCMYDIIVILLAHSEWVATKNHEIKSGKNITSCSWSTAVDPAKRDAERVRIELAMPDFRTEHCQLIVRA